MDEWKTKKLGTECELITKGTTPTSYGYAFQSTGINFIKVESITEHGKFIPGAFAHISDKTNATLKRSILKKDDCLFSIAGALGRVALVDESILPANTNQALAIIRLKEPSELHQRYLFYYLNSEAIRRHISAINVQLAQANLSLKDVGEFEIVFPPISAQKQIASILSSIDRVIELTEALIIKQQRLKAGLMQQLLTKGIDEHGKLRSEATHEFKDSPLGRIPAEWDVAQIREVKIFLTSGSRGWAQYYSDDGDLFLRIGNLTREHINLRLDNITRVNLLQVHEGTRTALQEDDLLISITADLGLIGMIPSGFERAFVNQHIALVRLDQSVVYPRWVAHFLASRAGQHQFQMLNETGAKAGLNLPAIASLLFARPKSQREQELISDILDKCDSAIVKMKRLLSKCCCLKDGLMQDLLTGKIRVNALLETQPRTDS